MTVWQIQHDRYNTVTPWYDWYNTVTPWKIQHDRYNLYDAEISGNFRIICGNFHFVWCGNFRIIFPHRTMMMRKFPRKFSLHMMWKLFPRMMRKIPHHTDGFRLRPSLWIPRYSKMIQSLYFHRWSGMSPAVPFSFCQAPLPSPLDGSTCALSWPKGVSIAGAATSMGNWGQAKVLAGLPRRRRWGSGQVIWRISQEVIEREFESSLLIETFWLAIGQITRSIPIQDFWVWYLLLLSFVEIFCIYIK